MEDAGKILRINKSVPKEFVLVLRLAKTSGWWIYQKSTKKWFTPDGFHEAAHRLIKREPGGHSNDWDFHAADPWEGLRARVGYLERVTGEIAEFASRLESFYKKREHHNK